MKRRDAAAAAQAVAQTPEGATLLNYLVGRYGFSRRSTYDPDPYRTAMNEGQRSVLVDIGILLDLDLTAKENTNGSSSDPDDADSIIDAARAAGLLDD